MNAIDYDAWDLHDQAIPGSAVSNGRNEPTHPIGWLPDVILLRVRVNDWGWESTEAIENGRDCFGLRTCYGPGDKLEIADGHTTCTVPVAEWPRVKAGLDTINAEYTRKAGKDSNRERPCLPVSCEGCEYEAEPGLGIHCRPCVDLRNAMNFAHHAEYARKADPALARVCHNCKHAYDPSFSPPCVDCSIRTRAYSDHFVPRTDPRPCPTCGK